MQMIIDTLQAILDFINDTGQGVQLQHLTEQVRELRDTKSGQSQ